MFNEVIECMVLYRNSVNGGYLIPLESQERLIERVCTGDKLAIDIAAPMMPAITANTRYIVPMSLWLVDPIQRIAPVGL